MKIVLVGAGQRGRIYADYIFEKGYAEFVAVVEPDAVRREAAARHLHIPAGHCFERAEDLWALGPIAQVAIIASMDRDHYAQVMSALSLGYDLILEKPISPSPAECLAISKKADEEGRRVVVCHVLRYTPFFSAIKNIIDSGELGKVVSIRLDENIGNFHMAHSFVRGNWRRKELSSPIIMQKSCHDMDLLHWLAAAPAASITSYGSLRYFKAENAPTGAAKRCCDCPLNDDCRFSAYKGYLPAVGNWPATMVTPLQTEEAVREALKTSPYGRCVYYCDNDVCDTQVAAVEFENGATASFTMSAFTNRMNRTIKVMCEDGEIEGDDGLHTLRVTHFASNQIEGYSERTLHTAAPQSGHGGGDSGLVDDFFKNAQAGGESQSSIARSVESHIMAAAAEKSRLEKTAVDIAAYRRNLLGQ